MKAGNFIETSRAGEKESIESPFPSSKHRNSLPPPPPPQKTPGKHLYSSSEMRITV